MSAGLDAGRLLVVAPHCDDAELGAGGAIARAVDAGGEVELFVMSAGDLDLLHTAEPVSGARRRAETRSAMQVLGVKTSCFAFHDAECRLDALPLLEGISRLDAAIDAFCPDRVLIPLPSAHQDHLWTHRAAVAALRPSRAGHRPGVVLAYEYPLSAWGGEAADEAGGLYLDIGRVVERKRAALACHASQMRGARSLISVEAALCLARMRGFECGCEWAERFRVLRWVQR